MIDYEKRRAALEARREGDLRHLHKLPKRARYLVVQHGDDGDSAEHPYDYGGLEHAYDSFFVSDGYWPHILKNCLLVRVRNHSNSSNTQLKPSSNGCYKWRNVLTARVDITDERTKEERIISITRRTLKGTRKK